MNAEERKTYYRDYMRLRRAAEKAGYDVSELSHDDLFDLAEQGLIKPSARKPQKHLTQTSEASSPVTIVASKPTYTPTTVKPKRVKAVSSEVSELQQALIWFIGLIRAEDHNMSETGVIERMAYETGMPLSLWRDILIGKSPGKQVLERLRPFIGWYRNEHRDGVPIPAFVPSPESMPRSAFPIAKNKWHTKVDQVNEFNRKRTI